MQNRPFTDDSVAKDLFVFTPSDGEKGALRYDGSDVGMFAGVELVAYFAVDGVGWLVVTDCDCPFEEMVFLHLLKTDMSLIEMRSLGGAYTAGIVEGMERLGPAEFRLLFPSKEQAQFIAVAPRRRGLLGLATGWLHVTPG